MFRSAVACALGVLTILLVASILGTGVKNLTLKLGSQTILAAELISDCFGCAIGGAVATVLARNRRVSFYAGALIVALLGLVVMRGHVPFPTWFLIVLASLILPATVVGAKLIPLGEYR